MKNIYLLILFICVANFAGQAQIAVGPGTPTADASSMLDVQATDRGLLMPRLTAAQITAITTPATSLIVYQTDGTPGYYYNSGTPALPVWTLLATGSGGTGYIQNQVAADQAASFRITGSGLFNNGNGLFNGGQVTMGTVTPVVNSVLTIRAGTLATSTLYPRDYLVGIDLTMQGLAGSGTGINLNTANQNFNNFLSTHTSNSTSNAYYGVGSLLNGIPASIVSGYLGYRSTGGSSYGIYGVNGTPATYLTGATSWAAFLQGRTVISSESAPTSPIGTDLEVRNTTPGSVAPATVSLRQTTSNITGSTFLANLNFGDNYTTNPQAQIQVLREAASSGATDLPTAITFKTITDNDATVTLTERMRISNNGNIGINQPTPDASAILDINSSTKGVRLPQVSLSGGATAAGSVPSPATGLIVYNTFVGGTIPNDVSLGYYYNSGSPGSPAWKRFATSSSVGDAWVITGNNNITTTTAPAIYGTSTFSGQNFLGASTLSTDVIFGSSNIERMRLQSTGQLSIGSNVPGAKLDVHQTTATAVGRFTTYGSSSIIELRRTGGSQAVPTATSGSNTFLGRIFGQGYDGVGFTSAASIAFETDASGGTTTDMPGRISFNTTLDGTGSPAERMRIDNSGKVGINLTPSMRLDVTDASTTTDDATIRGVATGAARVYGILGTTNSIANNASGVRGFASGTSGLNNGVWGESASSGGSGVYGSATNADGDGLFGFNTAASGAGTGAGVYGISSQTGGAGVQGDDLSNSTLGNGIKGTTTTGSGVRGLASGNNGWGVYGQNSSTGTGTQIAIYGEKNGATGTGTGYGVWGTASGTGSFNIGGRFKASGATNNFAIQLEASGNTNTVTISPNATTASYNITLPPAVAAVAGSVLTSSTTGVTTWTDPGSIGGFWSRSGGSLSPATITDKVGIGIAAPVAFLEVRTSSAFNTAGYDPIINLGGNTSNAKAGTIYRDFQNGQAYLGFESIDPSSLVKRPLVFQEFGGTVGIGTNNPSGPLHVRTGSGNTFIFIDNNAATTAQSGINLQGGGATRANFYFDPTVATYGTNGALIVNNVGGSSGNTLLNPTGGRVGIGNNTIPTALFSVGSTSQFQVNTTGAIAAATGITSSGTITFSTLNTPGIVTNAPGGALSSTATTGTGNVVLSTSPTLVTPVIGAATGTSLSVSGQLTSTVTTGTAPLVVSSTTNVANLNASSLSGATFSSPGAIGNSTASTGVFTNLSATKLNIATGANASIGTATLVAGDVIVNTTAVTTGSIIMVSINTPGGTAGFISVPSANIVTGTSFVINSSNGADTSTINWWIVN